VSSTHYDDDMPWRVHSLVEQEEDDDMNQAQFAEWLGNALHNQRIGRSGLSFAAALDEARKDAGEADKKAGVLIGQISAVAARLAALEQKVDALASGETPE
jgi:hypothetical protein